MTLKPIVLVVAPMVCFGTIQSNMTLKHAPRASTDTSCFGTIQSNMTLKPQIGFIQSSLGRRNL